MFYRTRLMSLVILMGMAALGLAREPDKDEGPIVQVALLLDTSNSMDGLINQARSQLWKIVNQFNHCKYDGKSPRLQVALYEYGNNNLAAGEGYIRMVLPLTTDLDLVSEKLWSLKTNGGEEYCGQVIHNAANELNWSKQKSAYRAIFIAGNEPFVQGTVDFHKSCAEALEKGVVVNTIHCGPESVGREGSWAEGAKAGEGKFLNIDQDHVVVDVRAPQDDDITKLSTALNSTYVPYGKAGFEGQLRQAAQDSNVNSLPSANSERAASKTTSLYSNSGWDLVDAIKDKKIALKDLKDEDLSKELQSMTPEAREKYIAEKTAKRAELQVQLAKLVAEREKFVSEAHKKANPDTTETLDSAVLKAVREQLNARDFKAE